jgi:hypothetical protein
MMTFLHYYSAYRRLQECEKTVMMLAKDKYTEEGVPIEILAQRDFIKKEVEFYKEKSTFLFYFYLSCVLVSCIILTFYFGVLK